MDSSKVLKQLEREAEVGRAVMDIIAKLKAKYTVRRASPDAKKAVKKKVAPKKVTKKELKAPVPPAV